MIPKKFRKAAALAIAAGVLSVPLMSQAKMDDGGGSIRKVLSCNVDGTYTCANERCEPGYCCQIGG